MRAVKNTQSELSFQLPSLLPISRAHFGVYDRMSEILDLNPKIVELVHRDLAKPLSGRTRRGPQGRNCTFSADTALRVMMVRRIEGLSMEDVVIRIDDSPRLRDFVRIHNGRMMGKGLVCTLECALRPETWEEINAILARFAQESGAISGERLRLDTTAVETNIHWPQDSSLMWDVYRVMARLVQSAREIDPTLVGGRRLHKKAAKRLHTEIGRTARRRTSKAKKRQKDLYRRLIALLESLLEWVCDVCARLRAAGTGAPGLAVSSLGCVGLAEEIERCRALGIHVLDQVRRRVIDGEKVPNGDKLFSIFEPHTELLIRGKAGKEIEFGHMVSIEQVEGKFITGYDVLEKRRPDFTLVDGAIERHQQIFGCEPDELAADKGYWESPDKTAELRQRIKLVAIPKKGGKTEDEQLHERSHPFRMAQCFRAGVEGSISVLKRAYGMWRCINRGFDRFVGTIGSTVFAHNLCILARGSG